MTPRPPTGGSCAGMDPAEADRIFFGNHHRVEAQAFCFACPVKQQCEDFATATRSTHGTFGGETGVVRRGRLGISRTGADLLREVS